MRIAGETVGGRGIALLAVTAVVGVVLASHGWAGRHNGLPSTLAGASAAGQHRPGTHPAPPATSPGTAPTQGPAASPSPTATPKITPGPKLGSQSYSSYAFQVWPGTVSSAAKAAEIGLVIKVRQQGSGISVSAGVAGQTLPAPTFYPNGTRVYVIEASLGDDSGNSDYNLGDDGLVVTDAQGRILQ
jgi:hypothetical protein